MVSIKITGLDELTKKLRGKLLEIADKDKVIRTVATSMCAEIRERIHEKGLNADGGQIGEYKEKYLKYRQNKYNRTSDKKVIISLSRQLENDFSIGIKDPIKTSTGWGLGFKNQINVDKAEWMEEKYGKIWNLTSDEKNKAQSIAEFETQKILNKK